VRRCSRPGGGFRAAKGPRATAGVGGGACAAAGVSGGARARVAAAEQGVKAEAGPELLECGPEPPEAGTSGLSPGTSGNQWRRTRRRRAESGAGGVW